MNKPQRITFHWTAGGPKANSIDIQHYHYIFEADGTIVIGHFKPEDNVPPLREGFYARHCGGGNSYNIGLALCGGPAGYKHGEITRLAFERACHKAAELCLELGFTPNESTIQTHYGFGKRNPNTSSAGKPDISSLPWAKGLKPDEIETYILGKVRWYYQRLLEPVEEVLSPIPDEGQDEEGEPIEALAQAVCEAIEVYRRHRDLPEDHSGREKAKAFKEERYQAWLKAHHSQQGQAPF